MDSMDVALASVKDRSTSTSGAMGGELIVNYNGQLEDKQHEYKCERVVYTMPDERARMAEETDAFINDSVWPVRD